MKRILTGKFRLIGNRVVPSIGSLWAAYTSGKRKLPHPTTTVRKPA